MSDEQKSENTKTAGEDNQSEREEGKTPQTEEKDYQTEGGETEDSREEGQGAESQGEQTGVEGGTVEVGSEGHSNWKGTYKGLPSMGGMKKIRVVREESFFRKRQEVLHEELAFVNKRLARLDVKHQEMMKKPDNSEGYGNAGQYDMGSNPPPMSQA